MMRQKEEEIPFVDRWTPRPEQVLFQSVKNNIVAPLSKFFQMEGSANAIDYFKISPKRSYNSEDSKKHTCLYLNYFEAYFDEEKEYFTNMAKIKFSIDYYREEYHKDNFISDVVKYILQKSIFDKIHQMVEYNYNLSLSYNSTNNPQLQYTDEHAKILSQISILINLCIPLITHFVYVKRILEVDEFLLDVYDYIIYAPPFQHVDINSKLYETSISNISNNEKNNPIIWAKQSIRGKDVITHSLDAISNIYLSIISKFTFEMNMINLNYTSNHQYNKHTVTYITYEYSYIPLSSSKRDDEDNASEMDKYEQHLVKQNEALYLQSKVNCQFTLDNVEKMCGPFDEKEIHFYMRKLKNEEGEIINGFQKQLVFNMLYKYFEDTVSINAINVISYIKLMLSARDMLKTMNLTYLSTIIASKVEKVVTRKSLNKKELVKMQSSQYYKMVEDKYKNDKIIKQMLSYVATIITSSFRIIDYRNPELNGKPIEIETDIIIEEILLFMLMV